MSEITFLGAAQTVTRSRHLLRTARGHRVLVDSGLFQGLKALRERLLGSAFVRVTQDDAPHTFLSGGDLGRHDRPVMPDPTPVAEADVLRLVSQTQPAR